MSASAPLAQSTNSVLMIRPSRFYPNPETAIDNAFQFRGNFDADALAEVARSEFDFAVQGLRDVGVKVHVFQDTAEPEKPDAVFPIPELHGSGAGATAHEQGGCNWQQDLCAWQTVGRL